VGLISEQWVLGAFLIPSAGALGGSSGGAHLGTNVPSPTAHPSLDSGETLPQVHPATDVSLVTEAFAARSAVLRLTNVMDAEQQRLISREHALSVARAQMEASFHAEAQRWVQRKSELDRREEVLDQHAFAQPKEEEWLDEVVGAGRQAYRPV
jgi:hypothetical protein